MPDEIGRRTVLSLVSSGIASQSLLVGSTSAQTNTNSPDGWEGLLNKLAELIDENGEIVDSESYNYGETTRKILEFENGYEALLVVTSLSNEYIFVQIDGEEYILDKENRPNTDTIREETQPTDVDIQSGTASTAGINPPSEPSDPDSVTIGEDRTFTDATGSRTRTVNDWLGQDAQSRTEGNECQILTKGNIVGIPGAYAQTWVNFDVTGGGSRFCEINIDTEGRVSWICASAGVIGLPGGATGKWKAGIYVFNLSELRYLEKQNVASERLVPVDYRSRSLDREGRMGVLLESGNQYVVGIYAGASSVSGGLSSATVDMMPNPGNQRFTWNSIELNWN